VVASMLALVRGTAVAQGPAQDPGLASAAPTVVYTPIRPAQVASARHQPGALMPSVLPRIALSSDQVDALADLFESRREEVVRRLSLDPGLAPLALEALYQHRERRNRGTAMTVAGWIVVGLGTVVGMGMFLEGDTQSRSFMGSTCDSACRSSASRKEGTGVLVGFTSTVLGLGLALPGMKSLRQRSDAENKAFRRYQGELW
jgi:hypothetical protein